MLQNPQFLNEMTTEDVIELILSTEQNDRAIRRQKALLKVSRIPEKVSLGDIIHDKERGNNFTKNINTLCSLNFVKNGNNLCIFGGSGSDKTYIACLLGSLACMNGYSTRFYTTKDMINTLKIAKGSNLYKSRRECFKRTSLLIIDDFCLSTNYSAEDQEILFDILNDRYRYKSVIVTSQKSPDQWVKDLCGTTIAEAIVERLANNNFDLVLEGKSLRTSLTLADSK